MYNDVGETEAAEIVASAPGVVFFEIEGVGGLNVDHGDGWYSQYLHMSELVVEEGDELEQGDLIGYAGDVGSPGAHHLHYQQIYDSNWDGSPTEGNDNGPDELVQPVIQGEEYSLDPVDDPNWPVVENAVTTAAPALASI